MMDEENGKVRALLASWGLKEDTISLFIDNSMDVFAIEHMDDVSIRDLLPAHGQRIRFVQKRAQWINSLNDERSTENNQSGSGILTSLSSQDLVGPEDNSVDAEQIVDDILQLPSMPANNSCKPVSPIEELDCFMASNDPKEKPILIAECDGEHALVYQMKEPLNSVENCAVPAKKFKSYDIIEVLSSSPEGKTLISLFKKDQGFSKDSTRDVLVSCIIQNEISDDMGKMISRERFKFLASEIAKAFCSEDPRTYYEQYKHPKSQKMIAKGKLVNKFYNIRRKFTESGLISKQQKDGSEDSQAKNPPPCLSIDKAASGSLCWLEQNRGGKGNWDEVLQHWRATSEVRMFNLIHGANLEEGNDKPGLTDEQADGSGRRQRQVQKGISKKKVKEPIEAKAYEYMSQYHAFQDNSAYMLFDIDFAFLKPDVPALSLFSEWSTLSLFVTRQVQKKDADFLQDTTLSRGEKTLLILLNLAKIFPIVNVVTSGQEKSKGKKNWRPSHAEMNDAFLRIFPTIIDLEEFKIDRRNQLQKYRLSLQPFAAVVGPSEDPLQYLVCVDEFFYEVESPLKAVDVVFKSFFALHTPYPAEAQQIWLFLQRTAYGLTLKEDAHFVSVSALCKDYQLFKKNPKS